MALQDLYKTLDSPPVLEGWRGGDPCEESWRGVVCSGSSVIHLKIQGLNLTGHLGGLLYKLQNLKQLDVSSNKLAGEIFYRLPPNATHVNLSLNYLNQTIPHSLTEMKRLRHLNLSHNSLSGPIGNVFTGLDNLKDIDLSYNNFTGDLPSSFGSLTSLTKLFLQNNRFTGSVTYLAELPLTNLNIQDNLFSGIIPQQFQFIPNLWMGGNKLHAGDNSPPWAFPLDNIPVEQNISHPPTTQANEIENCPPPRASELKKKHMGPGGIAFMVGGGTLLATGAALLIAIRLNLLRAKKLNRLASNQSLLQSHSTSGTIGRKIFRCSFIIIVAIFALMIQGTVGQDTRAPSPSTNRISPSKWTLFVALLAIFFTCLIVWSAGFYIWLNRNPQTQISPNFKKYCYYLTIANSVCITIAMSFQNLANILHTDDLNIAVSTFSFLSFCVMAVYTVYITYYRGVGLNVELVAGIINFVLAAAMFGLSLTSVWGGDVLSRCAIPLLAGLVDAAAKMVNDSSQVAQQ